MILRSIFFGLLLLAVTFLSAATQPAKESGIGSEVPDFSLKDVNGKIHNLIDYKGKYVVLEWTNFDCPFVKKHYGSGNMKKLQKEFTEQGVIWLSICSSAPGKQGNFDAAEIKKRISDSKANMSEYLIDEEGMVGKLFGARTTPHLFIINPDGKLIYQGGIDDTKSTNQADIPNSKNFVKAALDESLSGKPVTISTTQPYGCPVKYKD
ncbi:MAG: thioredoxin family protein [Candidatus Kapabacteria bacterium]|nr:thioredoxin family protein [Candidatus Kapabacteria bacterium]